MRAQRGGYACPAGIAGICSEVSRDHSSGKGVVLLNKGDGTFQTQSPGTGTGTGTGAGGGWSLRVGDFNGDKKPDLALPNNSGSSNSVFLNTST